MDGQLEKKKTNKFLPNQTKLKLQLLFLLLLNKPTLQRLGLILASVSCPAIKYWFQKLFFLQIFPRICDDETETEAIFIYFPPFIDYAKYEEYTLLGMYRELHSGAELSYSFPWEFLYRTFM